MASKICPCCGETFQPHHKVPNQTYCSSRDCQRERRQLWDRKKQQSDPEYRDNKNRVQRAWTERNSDYWRKYRKSNSGPGGKTVQNPRQTALIAPSPVKMDDLAWLGFRILMQALRWLYKASRENNLPAKASTSNSTRSARAHAMPSRGSLENVEMQISRPRPVSIPLSDGGKTKRAW